MVIKVVVTFEVDVLGIQRDNVKEKIIPYIDELTKYLINNECENVRIQTKIRKLSEREAEVYISTNDIKNIK